MWLVMNTLAGEGRKQGDEGAFVGVGVDLPSIKQQSGPIRPD